MPDKNSAQTNRRHQLTADAPPWPVADEFAEFAVTRFSSCPHRLSVGRPVGFPAPTIARNGDPMPGPQVRSLSVIQSVKCKWFTLIGPSLPYGPRSLVPRPLWDPTVATFFHRVLFPQPRATSFFLPYLSFSRSFTHIFLTLKGFQQGRAFSPRDPKAPRAGPPICSAHVCDQPPAEQYMIHVYMCMHMGMYAPGRS